MKWFKVEDQMPKTNEDVLVSNGKYMAVAYNDSYSYWTPANVETTYDFSSAVLDMGTITHWSHLPNLPLIEE